MGSVQKLVGKANLYIMFPWSRGSPCGFWEFNHSFSKYLLRAHDAPDTVLEGSDVVISINKSLALMDYILMRDSGRDCETEKQRFKGLEFARLLEMIRCS